MLGRQTLRTLLLPAATWLTAFTTLPAGALLAQQASRPVRPSWSEATLCSGSHCGESLLVAGAILPEHPVEGGSIRVEGSVVERLDESRAVVWRHDAGRFVALRFLTEFDGSVIFAESAVNLLGFATPGGTMRRLQLVDGQKLESLKIPATPDQKKNTSDLLTAVTIGDALFVLSRTLDRSNDEAWRTRSYRVDRYKEAWTWSRSFEAAPPSAGARRFEFPWLDPNLAGIQSLSRMGDSLVVCAGPLEDIVSLDSGTGETRWSIPRLWEYQKGYVGPSVHSHFIDRYGWWHFDSQSQGKWRTQNGERSIPDFERDPKKAESIRQRKERAEKSPASIVAGPVVLPVVEGKGPRYSVFVVTSQSADVTWAEALAECVVYELDEGGDCIGMATLPRFVNPARFTVLNGSVVWQCDRSDWLRLFPSSRKSRPLGGGIGNPAKTIDFEWHPARLGRAPAPREAWNKWLCQGVFVPTAAFRGETMLSITEGGFIEQEDSRVFRYPLMLTDFESGETRRLMLYLPFTGDVIPPEGWSTRSGDQWTAETPFLMTIESLIVRGHKLHIEFHYGFFRSTLVFDMDKLLATD